MSIPTGKVVLKGSDGETSGVDKAAVINSETVPPRKFVLKSLDGEIFEVDEAVAMKSLTIKHMVEDVTVDSAIPIPNASGKTLAKIIEYCKKHVESQESDDKSIDEELKVFDAEFVKVDLSFLFDLVLAANYLDIKSLLDLICQAIAEKIKDKSPEEVRKIFNIANDFTPEEELTLREEYAWAYE